MKWNYNGRMSEKSKKYHDLAEKKGKTMISLNKHSILEEEKLIYSSCKEENKANEDKNNFEMMEASQKNLAFFKNQIKINQHNPGYNNKVRNRQIILENMNDQKIQST
jgi:hypothetical protein